MSPTECPHGLLQVECATCGGLTRRGTGVADRRLPGARRSARDARRGIQQSSAADKVGIRRRIELVLEGQGRSLARDVRERVEERLARGEVPAEPLARWKLSVLAGPPALPALESELEEVLIFRALARTGDDRQFGVTPRSEIFASRSHGYTHENERLYITGLSPLIDDVAWHFNAWRSGTGGRLYESHDMIVDAASHRRVFLLRY